MVRSLDVSITQLPEGGFSFVYRLFGDMARLSIPQPRPTNETTEPCEGLWEHTCFEAFIAVQGETAYREFNFSPSGQWAAYAFSTYRQAEESVLSLTPPVIISNLSAGGFVLSALLAPDALPTDSRQRPLRVGLCAVIESRDTLGYWALHHATERPDFHHPESFTLILP